ncbi:hypothetical protein QBC38DRAFT_287997 [Podospora fimiseda]|uniref:Uncharacterized protein n=1 Tax=Podospora fimiseda TaxID=252190 RepID=A0AAN7H068_9PEZI|nr:hypothetical protein QBC38DRAFT_287997 [Podospora fimiseda]
MVAASVKTTIPSSMALKKTQGNRGPAFWDLGERQDGNADGSRKERHAGQGYGKVQAAQRYVPRLSFPPSWVLRTSKPEATAFLISEGVLTPCFVSKDGMDIVSPDHSFVPYCLTKLDNNATRGTIYNLHLPSRRLRCRRLASTTGLQHPSQERRNERGKQRLVKAWKAASSKEENMIYFLGIGLTVCPKRAAVAAPERMPPGRIN